jgi:hypothetical protein
VTFARSRIFVVFLSDELGGAQAAALMKDRVLSIHRFRKVSTPTKVADVLDGLKFQDTLMQRFLTSQKARLIQ